MRTGQQERLTAETHEDREARLERMRAAKQERLTAETHEEREARLERLRAAQQERLTHTSTHHIHPHLYTSHPPHLYTSHPPTPLHYTSTCQEKI